MYILIVFSIFILYPDAMNYLIICLITLLPPLFIRYIIVGKKAYKINLLLFTLCVIIIPIGLYLSISNLDHISTYASHLSRPTITGLVTKSEIVGNKKAFRPEITYQYIIDSTTYTKTTSLNSPMFGNKRKQYDVAKVTTDLYKVGSTLDVLYNPNDPSDSELHISLPWNVFGQLGFGMTLLMIAIFGLSLPRKKSWL